MKVGDVVDGIFVGLPGYKLAITGGSDKDGVPLRGDLPGVRRKPILVSNGVGFHAPAEGMRRRKLMRGNTVAPDVSQINLKITQQGSKSIADLLAKEEKK